MYRILGLMRSISPAMCFVLLVIAAGCGPRMVGGVTLDQHLADRTALVVSGRVINFTDSPSGGGIVLPPGHTTGSAVALSSDGYFLTATHTVRNGPVYLFVPTPSGLRPAMARVVWMGAEVLDADFALVHVPVSGGVGFEWSPQMVTPSTDVIAACRLADRSDVETGQGMVISSSMVDGTDDMPGREVLLHTTPMREGFSGGPLIDLDGRLLGINVGLVEVPMRGRMVGQAAAAVRPQTAFLQLLIDRDRAARGPTTQR